MRTIRLSEYELQRIQTDAKERGMNFSQYIRFLTRNKPNEHIEVIKLFKELTNEINRIGNNINQITKYCNSGVYTQEDKKRLYAYMKCIDEKLEEVLDLYGNK